jgi:pimeloyl-ACP methyl ester carboxylesterase
MTTFQHATVRGLKVVYREAGSKTSPTIVLLHGFLVRRICSAT